MDLQSLTDQALEQQLQNSVYEETQLTTQIIHLLAEFERRRLFSKIYPSLFEYCVKTLKYSASAAQRRIDAMRAMKVMPELEAKILNGELNLTSISQAQSFFRQEAKVGKKYDVAAKREVFQKLEGKSARDCEKELVKISPSALPREGRRELTEDLTELKLVLNRMQIEKLEKVKCLLSHRHPHLTDAELIEVLSDLALKNLDPSSKSTKRTLRETMPAPVVTSKKPEGPKNAGNLPSLTEMTKSAVPRAIPTNTRYIPAQTRRAVWIRDGGRCTQPGCDSKYFLEIDHNVPFALGGTSELENLRLLCRTHNTSAAIDVFGAAKIESFLKH